MASSAAKSKPETREAFRRKLRNNELNDKEIEIEVSDGGGGGFPMFDIPGGQMGMINLQDMIGKAMGGRTKKRRVTVQDSYEILDRGRERQAARQRPTDHRRDPRGREQRHRLPR